MEFCVCWAKGDRMPGSERCGCSWMVIVSLKELDRPTSSIPNIDEDELSPIYQESTKT